MPAKGYKKRRYRWTEKEIIEKIKDWHERFGDIPSATDWNGSDCRSASKRSTERAHAWLRRAERFESDEWPWTGTVYKTFGGWNKAIEAAGFTPRPAYRNGLSMEMGDVTAAKLVGLAKQIEKEDDRTRRRVDLHELATAALTLALDLEGEDDGST